MPQPVGVSSLILSPPIALLTPVLDEDGPFAAGDHTLTDFLTTVSHGLLPAGRWGIGGTYGVLVQPNGAIPATWGYTQGYDSGGAIGIEGWFYFNRFAQVVVMHQSLSGAFITVQVQEAHQIQSYIPTAFIPLGGDRIGLNVSPDIAVDLYFLCLLA